MPEIATTTALPQTACLSESDPQKIDRLSAARWPRHQHRRLFRVLRQMREKFRSGEAVEV